MLYPSFQKGTYQSDHRQHASSHYTIHSKKDTLDQNKSFHSRNSNPIRQTSNIRQTIPNLIREMQQAISSNRTSPFQTNVTLPPQLKQIPDKYPLEVSIQKTQISLPDEKNIEDDIHLPSLQKSLMQNILMIREQKITFLEQLNKITDRKNQTQRAIRKLMKNQQKLGERLVEEFAQLTSCIKNNRMHQYASGQQFQPSVQQYLKLRSQYQTSASQQINMSSFIDTDYTGHTEKIKAQYEKYAKLANQFENALQSLNTRDQQNNNNDNIIDSLRNKVADLLQQNKFLKSKNIDEKRYEIKCLREQNQQILWEAKNLIEKKKRNGQVITIEGLYKIVQLEDSLKQQIVRQMHLLKKQYNILKEQNIRIRQHF